MAQTPQPVLPPPTPQQQPPVAPRVTFNNGMLTVVAENSRLGDVLQAIRARTGAAMDVAAGAAGERVVVQLGPAPPRQVLVSLLNASRLNYAIVGSDTNPDAIQRVLVTPAVAGNGEGAPANTAAAAEEPAQQPAEEVNTEAPDDQPQPTPQPQPAITPNQPLIPNNQAPNSQPPATERNPAENTPKTPEQLLQELQRMQQQKQQQQQNPPEKPPV